MQISSILLGINMHDVWRRRLRVWEHDFTAPSLDRLTALLLHKTRVLGRSERQFFEKYIRPGMVIADIGANQGLYTLLFSRLVGNTGKVIAFEPQSDMFQALRKNILANSISNVEPYQIAIGSSSGHATLSRSLIHTGDNRMAPGHKKMTSRHEPITVATFDDIVGEREVDFIKMDVQGWEREVFRGMEQLFRRKRDLAIHFEFWPRGLRNAGCDPAELLDYLTRQNFRIVQLLGNDDIEIERPSALLDQVSGNRFINLLASRGSASRLT